MTTRDGDGRGPLGGLRVVTIATNLPGPAAAARFVELGASVTKVEPPSGDLLAHTVPSYYEELASGQQVRTLDLKDPSGRRELDVLLSNADVFLTSHRTGALERLGLGWAQLHAHHPRLVHVAIVGQLAPDDDVAGHDLTYQASRGLVSPPDLPLTPVSDLAGGERAVTAALAALLERASTGVGSYTQVALADAADVFAAPVRHKMSGPGSMIGGGIPAYRIYAAAQGYVAVAALEPHFLRRLLDGLGVEATVEQLATAFASRTAQEWQEWALENDIPLVAVTQY